MTTCRIEGCDKPVYVKARQLCSPHYSSMHKKGQLQGLPPTMCSVNGCETRATARGFCNLHYKRFKRLGQVTRRTIEERFWRYVQRGTAEECWEWTGTKNNGYGLMRTGEGETKILAHRFSYELHVDLIPEGLQIDHLCRNKGCVNPAHLEAVTQQVNILRSENMAARYARRTECHICGGELIFRESINARVCRTCEQRRTATKVSNARAKRLSAGS